MVNKYTKNNNLKMFKNKYKYHEKYYFKYRCDYWIMIYIFIKNLKININQLIEYYFLLFESCQQYG